jgi:hypothetical protein
VGQPAAENITIWKEYVPQKNIKVRLNGWTVQSAKLAIAGTELQPGSDGTITVPQIDLHDTLVVEF